MIDGGLTTLLIGPPGTGKSHMAGTILEVPGVERAMLLAPKPREANSAKYLQHRDRLERRVFRDLRWVPTAGMYEAGAYTTLVRTLLELQTDDTVDAVILETFGDVVTLARHEILEPEEAETVKHLRDPLSYYGALGHKLADFTQLLTALSFPELVRPKHVVVTVHAQPTKEEDIKGAQTSEGRAKGMQFMGEVLPSIEGGFRRTIAGEFDIVGFTNLERKTSKVKEDGKTKMVEREEFVVQLNADRERHAKAAMLPKLPEGSVENSFVKIFELIGNE